MLRLMLCSAQLMYKEVDLHPISPHLDLGLRFG
jgi:hypothetical protein